MFETEAMARRSSQKVHCVCMKTTSFGRFGLHCMFCIKCMFVLKKCCNGDVCKPLGWLSDMLWFVFGMIGFRSFVFGIVGVCGIQFRLGLESIVS